MKTYFYTFTIAGLLTFSCNSSENAQQNEVAKSSENHNTEEGCLYDYAENLEELLLLDLVTEITGFSKEKVKLDYNKPGKNITYHSFAYSWEGSRKQIMDMKVTQVEVPKNDVVSISGLTKIDEKKFNFQYRNLTPDEKNKAKMHLEEQLKNQADKNNLTEEQRKMAQSMAQSGIDNIKFEEINNVGGKALWEIKRNVLTVFYIDAMFHLLVDVSDDNEENKQKAVAIAQKIISSCN